LVFFCSGNAWKVEKVYCTKSSSLAEERSWTTTALPPAPLLLRLRLKRFRPGQPESQKSLIVRKVEIEENDGKGKEKSGYFW